MHIFEYIYKMSTSSCTCEYSSTIRNEIPFLVRKCYECRSIRFGRALIKSIIGNISLLVLEQYDLEINAEIDAEYARKHYCIYQTASSFHDIFVRFSTASGIFVTKKDYLLYKSLRRKYSFSIILDVVAFKKLRHLMTTIYRKYYERKFRIVTLEVRQKGEPSISIPMRYKTGIQNSYLCRVLSPETIADLDDFVSDILPKFSETDRNSNGELIFKATKNGNLTQSLVKLYSDYSFANSKLSKLKLIGDYLDTFAVGNDYDLFCSTYDYVINTFDWFGEFDDELQYVLGEYLNQYITNTIALESANCTDRLLLFCKKSPIIAKFIWTRSPQFNSKEKRTEMSINLANKRRGAFIRSETIEDLLKILEIIKLISVPPEDRWVNSLKTMGVRGIQLYEELCDLLDYCTIARYPHWNGYIDSERIDSANALYRAKYGEAQRFYTNAKK